MNTSLDKLLPELIQEIAYSYLDASSLRQLRNTNRRMRAIFSDQRPFWFLPDNLIKDVKIYKGLQLHFKQSQDSNLLNHTYDHIVFTDNTEKFFGYRKIGDRCLFSKAPLNNQISILDSNEINSKGIVLSCYFEATVVEASAQHTMRVGVVPGNNNPFHPPGCGYEGIGYQSTNGHLALSAYDGDQFQHGPWWKKGDTVGVGYALDYSGSHVVYFTLNGNWVGESPPHISGCSQIRYSGIWHAAFSSSGPCIVKINMGQEPFLFDMKIGRLPDYLKSRLQKKPNFMLKSIPYYSFKMEPNVLPKCSDPYEHPVVTSDVIQFPDNGQETARVVMCNLPIYFASTKNDQLLFYFEVTVLEEGYGENSFMSIGLSVKPASPFHQIGWDRYSIGYHSDDGKIFFETHQSGTPFGHTYGVNSIVGCGYSPSTGSVYFTHNGELLGIAIKGFYAEFHACVAAIRNWRVRVNFGAEPFAFNQPI